MTSAVARYPAATAAAAFGYDLVEVHPWSVERRPLMETLTLKIAKRASGLWESKGKPDGIWTIGAGRDAS